MPKAPENVQGCPTERELEGLASGDFKDQTLSRHLELCPQCQRRLRDIQDNLDLGKLLAGAKIADDTPEGVMAESVKGFKLLSPIARGGQGIIYKAIQESTKRKVAVKVLLSGKFAGPQEHARFVQEIDLASRLRHPHIITVYESGTTQDGRPYLAMEYVRGLALDQYVKDQKNKGRFDTRSMLLLFAKVGDAINHAHQRGVIHRDIKPSNILVDDRGEPFVLDFGLAKTAFVQPGVTPTITGTFKGTLAYASPEQVRGDPSDIDIRSDIYSLGVVLYEMLTGSLPYPVSGHASATLRHILETEPSWPSTLHRAIDSDLETIVLRSLAKDPARRYPTAAEFVADVRHYLAGEPIAAKRDKIIYLLHKRLRRHKLAAVLSTACLAAGVLVGAGLATSWHFALYDANHALEIYKLLVNASTDAIMVVDGTTLNIVEVNPAVTKMFGWTREEMLTMQVVAISGEPEKTAAAVRKQAMGEQSMVNSRRLLRKDGTSFQAEIFTGPFKLNGNSVVVAGIRDLSHRASLTEPN